MQYLVLYWIPCWREKKCYEDFILLIGKIDKWMVNMFKCCFIVYLLKLETIVVIYIKKSP